MRNRIALLVWLASTSASAQTITDAEAAPEAPPMWADEAPVEPKVEALVVVPADEANGDAVDVDVAVNVNVEVPEGDPPEAPRAKATHFFTELAGGVSFAGDMGGATQLFIGAGGKRAGGFLRFYLVAGLEHVTLRSSEQRDYAGTTHALDLLVGLRIYVPVVGPVRLFTDLLVGGARSWSTVRGGAFEPTTAREWGGVATWGLGLQVRVTRQLAVGGRLGFRWASDPLEELHAHLGLREERRTANLTGSVAWMF